MALRIENNLLAEVINECFSLSMDGSVAPADRKALQTKGRILRSKWLNVVSKEFNDKYSLVTKANELIREISRKIKDQSAGLNKLSAIFNKIDNLAAKLDRIMDFVV